jgi:hypothetical protein
MSAKDTAKTSPKSAPAAIIAPKPIRTFRLLVTANPKKPTSASAARFALYKDGMTTAAYAEAVKKIGQPGRLAAADLLWDVRHEFISLS